MHPDRGIPYFFSPYIIGVPKPKNLLTTQKHFWVEISAQLRVKNFIISIHDARLYVYIDDNINLIYIRIFVAIIKCLQFLPDNKC